MKNFIAQIGILLIFIIQTAFPFDIHIWGINLSLVFSYLIAITFVFPFNQSLIVLLILLIITFLTSYSEILPMMIMYILVFFGVVLTKKYNTSRLLSYSFIFFIIFLAHLIFDAYYFWQNSDNWSQFGNFIVSFLLPDIIFDWLVTLFFITILQLFFSKSRTALDLE